MEPFIALIIVLSISIGLCIICAYLESEGLAILFWVVSVLVLFSQGLLTAAYYSNEYKCKTWAHRNNYEYNYSLWGDGCQVNIQGQWIAPKNVIVTDERE